MSYVYHMCVPNAHGGQERAFNPLELELQIIVSFLMSIQVSSSTRALSTVNTKTAL